MGVFRRGWGGVATMAAACTLALAGALVPLGDGPAPVAAADPGPVVQAHYATAQDDSGTCTQPERSLNPASGTDDGDAVARIRKYGKLKVGVDQNSYLWGFRDPATGDFAGFDIDIVKAIAKDILGDENAVQYLTVPTADRIADIQAGTVDMVVRTMTINCARIKDVAFSTAYFTAGQQILTSDDSPITGFDDSLKDKTVCTALGSTGDDELAKGAHGAHVMRVANQLDCLVQLQLGLADAVFTDNALAAGQAAQDPTVHLVGSTVTKEPYGVAMKLSDTDLVRRVNKVLNTYRADGSWQRSYHNWLEDVLPGIQPPAPLYK
ncbi:glutamate ABC transporter substrate-binding protein [Actinacidiphila bryophytorum]|uniref:Amino acid ABC transporter substrate-binding protein, PAAT family n=1 Tax=Actinacidiphila bryophytorum TaxID=1436133 RepID=A0A9W4E4E0_9ACTN|nr:glutamate ABC transporter substrate-binding protein [Actinacidiphila bryophytorum]CAG7626439.1 Amino acid ABC transporter substrate-binding protein, PAAT family [Actinacidiphila bryophytorum]